MIFCSIVIIKMRKKGIQEPLKQSQGYRILGPLGQRDDDAALDNEDRSLRGSQFVF